MTGRIGRLLKSLDGHWCRVLIVNEDNGDDVREHCRESKIPIIDLSSLLAELLSGLTPEEKQEALVPKLKAWLLGRKEPVLAFGKMDCLFSLELGVANPLVIFNHWSRKDHHPAKMFILFLRAMKRGSLLVHSDEGKPDYRTMGTSFNEGFLVGWEFPWDGGVNNE